MKINLIKLWVLSILTLFLVIGVASAGSFEDPESIDWKFGYGMIDSDFRNDWQKFKSQDYLPIDIETDTIGSLKYSGVWQKNTDGRGWVSLRNLSSKEFNRRWKEYSRKGYRLIDQDTTVVDGKPRYSMVMVENKEGLKWKSNRNLTSAQFKKKYLANKDTFKPIDVDGVEIDNEMRYSIIWLENNPRVKWFEYRDMTPATYGKRYQELKRKDFRVADLDCYLRKGKLTYAAIWEKNEAGRSWEAVRNLSSNGLSNLWKKYKDQGMRVTDIETCPSNSGRDRLFAAVWRENNTRYDWKSRKKAENKLSDFVNTNYLPGVAATIFSKGKILFRGGAGFADVEQKIKAHSGTIYRTASVAKAIAGVLAFDMLDAGLINLTDRTDSIVTSLKNKHTHTVLQLLQNTGCVGHYSDIPRDTNDGQKQYESAQKVLSEKQDGILASNNALISGCTPGSNYNYSTHGYTIAAAALEIQGKDTFDELIKKRIADPLNLSTLSAESRTSPDSKDELAKLYGRESDGKRKAISATEFQNNSWKWAGGGIQISPFQLAKLGNALLKNKLFPESVRDQMWAGSSANSNYGAGWKLELDGSSNVVMAKKLGRQQGALAHIRIDIKNEIVVVAMTNSDHVNCTIQDLTRELLGLARANP